MQTTGGVNATQYVHTDALGSPVAHSSSANPAVVINRSRFEPYGYVAQGTKPSANTSVVGFTGHVQDAETDLVYMQQRYYDPIAGRFLSVDPVVTDANTGKGFGLYTYVENNPYARIDPDGREMIAVTLPGIGKTYLDDAFAKKVDTFIAKAKDGGVEIKVNSAFRDQDKQDRLKNDKTAITPVDVSLHSTGNAIDVNYSSLQDVKDGMTGDKQREAINKAATDSGLSWGGDFKKKDPPHFYTDPGGDRSKKAEQAKKEVDAIKEKEQRKDK